MLLSSRRGNLQHGSPDQACLVEAQQGVTGQWRLQETLWPYTAAQPVPWPAATCKCWYHSCEDVLQPCNSQA